MEKDTVPDVAPPITPSPRTISQSPPPQATVSSINSFLWYAFLFLIYVIYHRLGWESVNYLASVMTSNNTEEPVILKILYYVWLVPIVGILASIVSPSVGSTVMWFIGSSIATGVFLSLAWIYVYFVGFTPYSWESKALSK
jgi:hypothetical protein